MFQDSLFDSAGRGKTNKPVTVAISFLLQVIALGIMMLIPLIYGQALPGRQLTAFLIEPPSPPPPSPPPAAATEVRVTLKPVQQRQEFVQPTTIPEHVAIIKEDPQPPGLAAGYIGVPGGTGEASAIPLTSIITPVVPSLPPPVAPPQAPIRVGGQVAAAKLISQPKPVYPSLARQARIQGTVRLEAVISKDGAIENLTVVSGHPLLIPAALEAVRQWRYQPMLLNGEPVEVITTVDVNFTLGG